MLKTDVHFPTDTNLLFDAIRKTIETCADLAQANGLSEWRQSAYNIRQFKKAYRVIQQLRHSTSKDEAKREAKRTEIEEAHGRLPGDGRRLSSARPPHPSLPSDRLLGPLGVVGAIG